MLKPLSQVLKQNSRMTQLEKFWGKTEHHTVTHICVPSGIWSKAGEMKTVELTESTLLKQDVQLSPTVPAMPRQSSSVWSLWEEAGTQSNWDITSTSWWAQQNTKGPANNCLTKISRYAASWSMRGWIYSNGVRPANYYIEVELSFTCLTHPILVGTCCLLLQTQNSLLHQLHNSNKLIKKRLGLILCASTGHHPACMLA